jgi:polar amino acid transport system substrate-binding protein
METALADAAAELAPGGVLRAALNMGNFLLVTGRSDVGEPTGVAPDMARAVAERLGARIDYVEFARPSQVADAAEDDVWDIALIGAEPQRAEKIVFSPPYVEIEATYLVRAGSPLTSIEAVDRPGVRICVSAGSAYGLWLERNIRHAALVTTSSGSGANRQFAADETLDALAALRSGLQADIGQFPGARILAGNFTTVQQAIGVRRKNAAGAAFLRAFVEEVKTSGFLAGALARHNVAGSLAIPPAGG